MAKDGSVISFYKYAKIDDTLNFQKEQFELCKSLGLKGRIIIGEEGINGSVCGSKVNIEKYKKELKSSMLFYDVDFKEQETEAREASAFRKLFVRVRKEIVNSGLEVDLNNTAEFITPKELKSALDRSEELVLVDVRNDYESKIGRFKNARTLSIKNFRDFPYALKEIEDLKNKKIVTYCTGGIRCEKASAFLKENDFKNVLQLKGGILNFGKEVADFSNEYWEGKCFVFDDRLAIRINKNADKNYEPLNDCVWCSRKSDTYLNCHNIECDKLFICCEGCKIKYNASCSDKCTAAPKRRKELTKIIDKKITQY